MDDLISLIVMGVLGVIIVVVFIWVYFLPTIVARKRKHKDESAIFVLNLLAGFTILFWIVALVWANNDNTKKHRDIRHLVDIPYFTGATAIYGLSGLTMRRCLAKSTSTSISSIGTAPSKVSSPKTNAPVKQRRLANCTCKGPT